MKINVKGIKADTNFGVSILPISTFVDISIDNSIGKVISEYIEDIFAKIEEIGCKDIIIGGNIYDNLENLSWLVAKLMSNLYVVSFFITLPEKIPNIIVNRFIIGTNFNNLKRLINKLAILSTNDLLLLSTDNIAELKATMRLMEQNKIKACLVINSKKISYSDLIEEKIFNINIIDS